MVGNSKLISTLNSIYKFSIKNVYCLFISFYRGHKMTISKKKLLPLALFISATTLSANVFAEVHRGTISFTGSIYSSTCTVSINGDGTDGNVNMGRYPASLFGTDAKVEVGGTNGNGQLDIKLVDCPPTGSVTLRISGQEDPNDSHILLLDNPENDKTAKNVGIYIFDVNDLDNPYNINFDKEIDIKSSGNASSTHLDIPLVAKYVSIAEGGVEAGLANSTLNYSITYK